MDQVQSKLVAAARRAKERELLLTERQGESFEKEGLGVYGGEVDDDEGYLRLVSNATVMNGSSILPMANPTIRSTGQYVPPTCIYLRLACLG